MKRRVFIKTGVLSVGALAYLKNTVVSAAKKSIMKVRLLRHATLVVRVNGKIILVDPMLSKKEEMDPVGNAGNNNRIPMVDLPIDDAELDGLLKKTDAVLLTHIHRDHWDAAAQQRVDKNKLILCQPADEDKIKAEGFSNVKSIENSYGWNGITIHRTNGQHGTGEIGKKMGAVSGFVLDDTKDQIYIAGDTIWCSGVKDAITTHRPTYIIVNGGGAKFIEGDPITMTVTDVIELTKFVNTPISVVHLETINHCLQRRSDFNSALTLHSLTKQVNIPADGEWLPIS
jgi:L-ascorbate metabolism protein UlaG (beta-lactamase superfamily)